MLDVMTKSPENRDVRVHDGCIGGDGMSSCAAVTNSVVKQDGTLNERYLDDDDTPPLPPGL